jgi:hypothetical protein
MITKTFLLRRFHGAMALKSFRDHNLGWDADSSFPVNRARTDPMSKAEPLGGRPRPLAVYEVRRRVYQINLVLHRLPGVTICDYRTPASLMTPRRNPDPAMVPAEWRSWVRQTKLFTLCCPKGDAWLSPGGDEVTGETASRQCGHGDSLVTADPVYVQREAAERISAGKERELRAAPSRFA